MAICEQGNGAERAACESADGIMACFAAHTGCGLRSAPGHATDAQEIRKGRPAFRLASNVAGQVPARAAFRRRSGLALPACVMALAFAAACQPAEQSYRVVDSQFMEFEELFSPADTVRFESSVLIGTMNFLDISDRGEFLITDGQMKAFHVFAASGNHVRTFAVSQCNPEDVGSPISARFLEDGSVIGSTAYGIYAFNVDGSCRKRLVELSPNNPSFCQWRDLVYFLNSRLRPPSVYAYSMESGIVEEHDLRMPEFPGLTNVYRGTRGRGIACFAEGVFYRYPESSDAEPVWPGRDPVVHRPTFFRAPEADMNTTGGPSAGTADILDVLRESTLLTGIFELDPSHRMVDFRTWRGETPLSIVNTDTQTSVSTVAERRFKLARDGLLYVGRDHEQLPSGEVGNQMLEVWQFHPFEPSNAEEAK